MPCPAGNFRGCTVGYVGLVNGRSGSGAAFRNDVSVVNLVFRGRKRKVDRQRGSRSVQASAGGAVLSLFAIMVDPEISWAVSGLMAQIGGSELGPRDLGGERA